MKKALKRSIIGGLVGLFISFVITVILSFWIGDGFYHPVVPELAENLGNEITAVTVQAVLSLVMGGAYAGASVIWESDWSITKMTVVHFLILSIATFPIAYLKYWMEHTVSGILSYIGIFVAIYIGIWAGAYFSTKKKVQEFNKRMKSK